MCVAAIAWQAHRDWLLVAVGNRDEYHARPATSLARWDDYGGDILAGRDLQSGGTWLGVSAAGRFALVTNLRGFGAADPDKASRGALVTDLLSGANPAPLTGYNPFNLILAGSDTASYLTNRPGEVRTHLVHGIYGLSNGALDEPWPKTLQLKSALSDWLVGESGDMETLFTALRSETLEAIGVGPSEPSDVAAEAAQTPVFIRNPVYGTRCSTVVTVDRAGQGTIVERRFDADGAATGETALGFVWDS